MQDGVPGYELVLHLCTCISIPVNLLAIFCIVTQTSSAMKKYKWYLLNVQIWIFLTDLILFILIAPRFYFPLIAGTMHGFFFHIGVPYEIQTIIGFGTAVGMLSACIQAIQYRHSQIVPPNSVLARNSRMKTLLNVTRYALFCQVSVPAVITEPRNQIEAKMRVAEKYPFHPDFFFDPTVYLLQETPFFVFVPGSLIIIYVFIELSFYILQSFRQLNKSVSHMSERTKKLQKKYFICICVQVLVPCLFCIIPIGFLCFAIVSGYHVQYMSNRPEGVQGSVVGWVCLDEIPFMGEVIYTIGHLKWSVLPSRSLTHGYNEILLSTLQLMPFEQIHVEMEIYAPQHWPNRMTFWHVFDHQRNSFCIPYSANESVPDEIVEPREGDLQKGKPDGAYLRIALNPKIWRYQNWQFPFPDLVLKIGNEELYVNRKILAGASRFFVYIMETSRVKTMKDHEVLYLRDVSFEDLYDLMGCIYHGWMFYRHRILELQYVAEMFGVNIDVSYTVSFEGRTSMERVALMAFDLKYSRPGIEVHQESHQNRGEVAERASASRHVANSPASSSSLSSISSDSSRTTPVERPTRINLSEPQEEPMEQDESESEDDERLSVDSSNRIKLRDAAPPVYVGCERTAVNHNRMFYKFVFEYYPNARNNYSVGSKFSVLTCFGCWDFYLYPKMVNSQKFLALGIYGTRFSPSFINDVMFLIQVQGGNRKPTKKVLQKVMSLQQNTLGYPNFLPWSEVENYSKDVESIVITVQMSTEMTHLAKRPEINYDSFPGRKDVFLRVDGIVFPVSRDVLSEASPVLKEMFDKPFLINRSQIYDLSLVTYYGFMVFLEYIYNRKTRVKRADYIHLFHLARNFEMHDITDQLVRDLVFYEELNEMQALYFAIQFKLKNFMYKYRSQLYSVHRSPTTSLIRNRPV
uniref:BTB domain-containing protein n=1 Tax=Caenorhabditis tropicalis TaxID=1561998 RepID=A0A1I7T2S3_9PELO